MTNQLLHIIARCFQRLSEPAALRLGRGLGLFWHDVVRHRRGQVRQGLHQAFGQELSSHEQHRLGRDNFAHYGVVLSEFLRLPLLDDQSLLDRFEITGLEHVHQARARGQGLIVLTAHVGNWEWLAAAQAALGLDIAIITRHAHQDGVDRYWQDLRRRRGIRFFDAYGSLPALIRHLRDGGAVGMSIDQNEGGNSGARVDFFGRESGTVKAPALLSARTGAPVIMALSWRDEDGRHHAHFSDEIPPVEGRDLTDTVNLTTRHYNRLLEDFIRQHPSQWTWVHRRWKPA